MDIDIIVHRTYRMIVMLTLEVLKEKLKYDECSGVFSWSVPNKKSRKDGSYYFIDALLAMATLELLWKIESDLSGLLGAMCLASIFLNTIGWVFYEFYLPPDIYNVSFLMLYIAAFLIIATGGNYAGGVGIHRLRGRVRSNSNAGIQLLGKDS